MPTVVAAVTSVFGVVDELQVVDVDRLASPRSLPGERLVQSQAVELALETSQRFGIGHVSHRRQSFHFVAENVEAVLADFDPNRFAVHGAIELQPRTCWCLNCWTALEGLPGCRHQLGHTLAGQGRDQKSPAPSLLEPAKEGLGDV